MYIHSCGCWPHKRKRREAKRFAGCCNSCPSIKELHWSHHWFKRKKFALGRVARVRRQHISTRVSLHGCHTKGWWAHTGPACHALHQIEAFFLLLFPQWMLDGGWYEQAHTKHTSMLANVRVLARPRLPTSHTFACARLHSPSADSEQADWCKVKFEKDLL